MHSMQTWKDWSENYAMEKQLKKNWSTYTHIYILNICIYPKTCLYRHSHTQTCTHVHLLNEAKEMFHFFFSHLKFISCNWPKFIRKSLTQNSKESWSLDSWSFITDDIQQNAFDILKRDKKTYWVDLLFLDISCLNWFLSFLSVSFSLHHSFSLFFFHCLISAISTSSPHSHSLSLLLSILFQKFCFMYEICLENLILPKKVAYLLLWYLIQPCSSFKFKIPSTSHSK